MRRIPLALIPFVFAACIGDADPESARIGESAESLSVNVTVLRQPQRPCLHRCPDPAKIGHAVCNCARHRAGDGARRCARWAARAKLKAMVEGAKIVRRELG